MKKGKRVLILILVISIVMSLTITVWAAKGSFSLSKTSVTLTEGQSTSININVTECEGQCTISSSNPEIVKVSKSTIWIPEETIITLTASKEGNAKITITASDVADTDENPVKGQKTIDVTVKSASTPTPPPAPPSPSPTNNGNEDPDKELPQEQVPTTNTTASSNNQLSSLKVDVGTLSPKFNSWTKEYTVDVAEEVENIKITANKSHSKATVAGTGTKKLNPGANVFKIDVTAENGSVNTYTITVNKPKPPEKEAELKLKSLTIKGVNTSREMVDLTYTPEFSEEVYSYEMEVEHDIESLSIEALAKEEGTIVEITGNENLVVGENIVTIIIKTANEEKSATYQIIVKKAEQLIAEAVVAEPETIPHDTIQSDYWMIMIIVAGVVAIVVGSIIIIILHKRQDRETEAFEIDSMGVFEEQKKSKKSKKAKEQNNIDDTKGKGRGRHF